MSCWGRPWRVLWHVVLGLGFPRGPWAGPAPPPQDLSLPHPLSPPPWPLPQPDVGLMLVRALALLSLGPTTSRPVKVSLDSQCTARPVPTDHTPCCQECGLGSERGTPPRAPSRCCLGHCRAPWVGAGNGAGPGGQPILNSEPYDATRSPLACLAPPLWLCPTPLPHPLPPACPPPPK